MQIFQKIDDFIIDKIFQRIADSLALWITPRALAQNTFMLCSLITIWAIWLKSIDRGLNIFDIVLGPLFVCFLLVAAFMASKNPPQGMAPTERISFYYIRIFVLFGMIFSILINSIFFNIKPINLRDIVSILQYVVELIGLYFMACRTNPPAMQRQRQDVWARQGV